MDDIDKLADETIFLRLNVITKSEASALDRVEAVAVLKEIVDICNMVDVKQITLKAVTESVGYELHIQDHFDEQNAKCLQDILQKHKLKMRQHDGNIVIYTPHS